MLAFPAWIWAAFAQSPEASVSGTVSDAQGRYLVGVKVTASQLDTNWTAETLTDSQGKYYFLSLLRGHYNFKADKSGYQGRMQQEVVLAVGDKRELSFTLSPVSASLNSTSVSDLLKILPPAPVLPVEIIASVSVVVDENQILQLPLASRKIYSLFLLQPGVTSQGAIVRRGLSFSVHGQHVSGSNYLLDGVDNNNTVLTGPVAAASAEAVQEFRMINSSFSAENGRATSFVAQVVTRAGGNRFHGSLYEFLSNEKLNANTFENNYGGVARQPLRHNQFGYSAGGPLQRNKKFFSSILELSPLRYAIDRSPTFYPYGGTVPPLLRDLNFVEIYLTVLRSD